MVGRELTVNEKNKINVWFYFGEQKTYILLFNNFKITVYTHVRCEAKIETLLRTTKGINLWRAINVHVLKEHGT